MDETTLKILERTLAGNPADWELRVHLMGHYLAAGQPARAGELLQAAPVVPAAEEAQLQAAQVLVATQGDQALELLQRILAANRGCARAYLLLARLYLQRGLIDEARRKYGAATVIEEGLADPELEQALGLGAGVPAAPFPAPAPAAVPADGGDAIPTAEEVAAAMAAVRSDPEIVGQTAKFSDIGGMADVVERIRMTIVYPFKNPELFKKYKKRPGGGILLYGPPGCGKTHIARATAGECEANFMSIAITDVLSKWLGQSERHLHELFETARRRSPTVIFIDEVDAIGVNRGESSNTLASVVNVLLTEMDGIAAQNSNLMILAATNAPWRVDSALRRPGRFDRVIFVPPPDEDAREAILRIHLAGIPAEALDLRKVAQATKRFSGADLRAVVDRATEAVIAQEMIKGPGGVLTQKLLLEAARQMRPSTAEWLETARSYASYANQSGLYDDLADYLEKH